MQGTTSLITSRSGSTIDFDLSLLELPVPTGSRPSSEHDLTELGTPRSDSQDSVATTGSLPESFTQKNAGLTRRKLAGSNQLID